MQEQIHPTDERLEAFSDGSLAPRERSSVASHVAKCLRCRAEVEDWRSLFAALAALPHFSPSPGFAARVMAHVTVPRPWYTRAADLLGAVLPRTTPGWAFAVLILAVPVVALGTFAVWLLSRSYLTVYRLWVFATDQFAHGANEVASGALTRLFQTDIMVWLVANIGSFTESAGLRGVSAVAVGGAAVFVISIWVLYRNLFRTPNRGSTYASYTF